jgi:hypothetical protein
MNHEILNGLGGWLLPCSALLGVMFLACLWFLSLDNPSFKYQHALLQIRKLSLNLQILFVPLVFFVKRKYRLLLLNCEYAFLQFLRCKFWLFHGYDPMTVDLTPNAPAHRRRAYDIRLSTEARSRRSVQPACSTMTVSYWCRPDLQQHELEELVNQREGQKCGDATDEPVNA